MTLDDLNEKYSWISETSELKVAWERKQGDRGAGSAGPEISHQVLEVPVRMVVGFAQAIQDHPEVYQLIQTAHENAQKDPDGPRDFGEHGILLDLFYTWYVFKHEIPRNPGAIFAAVVLLLEVLKGSIPNIHCDQARLFLMRRSDIIED
ncbi:hypothetical protein [Aestuariispira insulae]|uniref:Uncharacterized protein n=1 Tax=Aestuariispira insulae TaxID=1461337 RepID=A0A3D9H6W2_9PROT|nr:hypothetical protein [Aestuariispira insulae]RED44686.1 hypothetical protein DFP90_11448 [Aestuariispira insulae]